MTGNARCESTCVSPCPGKCFEQGAIPAEDRPEHTERTKEETASGSRTELNENARILIYQRVRPTFAE